MANPSYRLRGEYRWEVVDEQTGRVERSSGRANLILNQGLQYTASYAFAECAAYCAIGSGNTPPLSTDTGLTTELYRTGTLDTSLAVYAQTSLVGNVYSLLRVFKFANLDPTIAFGQIGWSPSSVAGNNLFSKAQVVNEGGIPSPVTVPAGKYLRVYYTLTVTLGPTTSTAGNSNIVGMNVAGTYSLQYVGLRSITGTGSLSYYDAGNDCNEPSAACAFFIGQSSTALSAFGSAANRSGATNYTTTASSIYIGNGVTRKRGTFAKNAANDAALRSFGAGVTGSSTSNSGFVFVFNAAQTKDNEHILTLEIFYNVST